MTSELVPGGPAAVRRAPTAPPPACDLRRRIRASAPGARSSTPTPAWSAAWTRSCGPPTACRSPSTTPSSSWPTRPGRRLRMSVLAERVLLSRSGITRLVDRLVADGMVERSACPTDARGAEAALTPAGPGPPPRGLRTHLDGVARYFLDVVTPTTGPPSSGGSGPSWTGSAAHRARRRRRPAREPARPDDRRAPARAGGSWRARAASPTRAGPRAFYPAGAAGSRAAPPLRLAPAGLRAQQHVLRAAHRRSGSGPGAAPCPAVVPVRRQGAARGERPRPVRRPGRVRARG